MLGLQPRPYHTCIYARMLCGASLTLTVLVTTIDALGHFETG